MAELLIHDGNYQQHLESPYGHSKGLVPRDFTTHPVGYLACAKPFDVDLIPDGDWQGRLDALIKAKALMSDIRNSMGPGGLPIPSRDQNGKGYCWAHSSTSAALLIRAINGQEYTSLSAYMVACIIKGYRDEGGWGAESLEFIAEHGIPDEQFWPQQSMARSNDTPEMRANASLHRYTEWMDLDPAHMKAQVITCLLLGLPLVCDFNWWSHSVCGMDLVSINPFRIRIWNSWGDKWSENGTGILEGSKALPDSCLAGRVMTVAA